MNTQLLSEKYSDRLDGVLNCYDRLLFTGSLHPFCYAKGMTGYLYAHGIRIFDYAKFAEPWREAIRAHPAWHACSMPHGEAVRRRTYAEARAAGSGLKIEFIARKSFRKEDGLKRILKTRGAQPGLVHSFSAMESCGSYSPWHEKRTGKTFLKYADAKCLHYYFYFIDEDLGLCYLRVPTWCPFRLQFYCNGHRWLAAQLRRQGIACELPDNAFVHIADYTVANQLAAQLDLEQLPARLDDIAQRYCPVIQSLQLTCHWSLMQVEYATDLVFKQRHDLQVFYPPLLETLIHTVKPEDIATFLGQKLHGNFQGEMGNRFNLRQLGTRIKHQMGPVVIKLDDKLGLILRIETTVNDVTFFQQFREVQSNHGARAKKWAPLKKTIYSLAPLQELLIAANRRYLAFISDIETPEVGVQRLKQLTHSQVEQEHRYKGFNLLAEEDAIVLRLLLRGEFMISGLTSRALRALLPDKTNGQVSRLLKRLRVHGLLKKVGHRYKYYLTVMGRQVATMALKLRELYVIPTFAYSPSA